MKADWVNRLDHDYKNSTVFSQLPRTRDSRRTINILGACREGPVPSLTYRPKIEHQRTTKPFL